MKILLDCDPGIDDVAAILYLAGLHHRGEVTLVGLSTVGGNVPVAQSTRVAALALALGHLEDEVPVYQGYDSPVLPPPPGFHGADGIGNCYFEHVRAKGPAHYTADDVVALIEELGDELTVVCLGPLTNAAIWAETLAAGRRRGPRRWVVMGGAFANHHGNVAPGVEFNFHADPDAAAAFFRHAAMVDVVPLNATERVRFTRSDIRKLTDDCVWLGSVLEESLGTHTRHRGIDYFWLHDLVAVAVLQHEKVFSFVRGRVSVETEPVPRRGSTLIHPVSDAPHRVALRVRPALHDPLLAELRASLHACLRLDADGARAHRRRDGKAAAAG